MKRLFLLILALVLATTVYGQAPASSPKAVQINANGDILPATINGHVPNLPAGTTVNGVEISTGSGLPDQDGHGGEYLTTDGTDASWATVPTWSSVITSGSPFLDFDPASGASHAFVLFRNNEVGTADFGITLNNYPGESGATLHDNVFRWGYNVSPTGRQNTSEHSFGETIESHYRTPALIEQLEHYWSYLSADGLTSYRPFGQTINLTTHSVETAIRDNSLLIGYWDTTNDWLRADSTASTGVMTLKFNSYLDFTGNTRSGGWLISKSGNGLMGQSVSGQKAIFQGGSGANNEMAIFPNANTDTSNQLAIYVGGEGTATRQRGLRWNGASTPRQWEAQDDSANWKRIMLSGDGSTVGQSIFNLTNPSAVTFLRMNADNTVTALSASAFKTAIGADASDVAYDSTTWDGNTSAPTKNAVRDKIEAVLASGGLGTSDIDTPSELQAISHGVLYPSRTFEMVEEFTATSTLWRFTGGGESAPTVETGEAGHIGLARFNTGAGSTNRSLLNDGASIGWLFGGGESTIEFPIRITTLSDGTETYTLRLGWGDSGSGDSTDGVYFRYTHSVNSGRWELVARSNSTETVTNSTSAPAAGTWYRLTIVVNAAGTSAEFFVDGASIGTVASNIPTGAGRQTGVYFNMTKSAGTTARTMYLDYIYLKTSFTTPR